MQDHVKSNKTLNIKRGQYRRASQQVGSCLKDFIKKNDLISNVGKRAQFNQQKYSKDYVSIHETKQLKECYLQLQKVLMDENINLKRQIQYLTEEVRKAYKIQKLEKEKITSLKSQKKQLCLRVQKLTEENQQIKQFVKTQLLFLMSCLQSTSLKDLIFEVKKIIHQFKTYLKIDINTIQNSRFEEPMVNSSYRSPININAQQEINALNDRFEALMGEYKAHNKSQIRKKCLDIAKQIQNIKKMNHLQDTTSEFSLKKHSNTERISIYDARDSVNLNLISFEKPQTDRAYNNDQQDKFGYQYTTIQKSFQTQQLIPRTLDARTSYNRKQKKSNSLFGQLNQIYQGQI